ncbi:pyocin knob domain-containing protein [Nocardioides nitrophenolicus]|uniref:pyocin knob domain-containing protein n=1 Tax=Nocardioides nitrophenolicus TaxID=60489 RepID=UPI00195E4699|nr:pyocin knob domain-containing protein [Nocardioides nitrophenolicus]MBM7518261.1 hypothetical protein [Nocardioides nitrophenolicus]
MTTSYNLTGNIRDLIGETSKSATAYLSTNLGDVALVDLDANQVRLAGSKRIPLAAGGTFTTSLIATNSTGTNISGGTLRYRVTVVYKDPNGQTRTWDSGLFAHTATQDLSDVVAAGVPPVLANEYLSKTLFDAKGDLLVGTANDTVTRLPVGNHGTLLLTDLNQASGLRWGSAGELPASTLIATGTNLDTIKTPGLYLRQTISNNTTALGYPIADWGGYLLVMAPNPGVVIQIAFSLSSAPGVGATQRNAWYRTFSTTWQPWTRIATPGAGTGSPEGVVTAPIGEKYTDLAATNGAIEWIKTTATGNTGWRVTHGDTGWRDLSGLLLAPYYAEDVVAVRRVNNLVHLKVSSLTTSGPSPGSIAISGIAGFQDASSGSPVGTNFALVPTGAPEPGQQWTINARAGMATAYLLSLNSEIAPGSDHYFSGSATWPITAPWPTTLPGTAL